MPDAELVRAQRISRIFDRYMVDPILGLIAPGVGDLAGSLFGLYAVSLALRRKLSPVVVARMLMNLSVDALLGAIPLVGDLFDLGFRAQERNARLLGERAGTGGRATTKDWLLVVGAALLFVGSLALAIWAVVSIFRALF